MRPKESYNKALRRLLGLDSDRRETAAEDGRAAS